MHDLVERYYIVVLLGRLQKPRGKELCSSDKRLKRSNIRIGGEYVRHIGSLTIKL
jgi:hypothetical protein